MYMMYVCAVVHVWRSGDNLWELVLFFPLWNWQFKLMNVRLVQKCFHSLGHLVNLPLVL